MFEDDIPIQSDINKMTLKLFTLTTSKIDNEKVHLHKNVLLHEIIAIIKLQTILL